MNDLQRRVAVLLRQLKGMTAEERDSVLVTLMLHLHEDFSRLLGVLLEPMPGGRVAVFVPEADVRIGIAHVRQLSTTNTAEPTDGPEEKKP